MVTTGSSCVAKLPSQGKGHTPPQHSHGLGPACSTHHQWNLKTGVKGAGQELRPRSSQPRHRQQGSSLRE
eukprot:12004038-Prorocentrum_lima.AAC.1